MWSVSGLQILAGSLRVLTSHLPQLTLAVVGGAHGASCGVGVGGSMGQDSAVLGVLMGQAGSTGSVLRNLGLGYLESVFL